jgi:hypothetical protein
VTAERRHPEGSSFREFFHEQWEQLVRLIEESPEERAKEYREEAVVTDAIENVVRGTDARIRALGGYKKSLREGVGALLQYVDELASALPNAVPFRQERFANDPMLSRLFVDAREMRRRLGGSDELRAFFADPHSAGVQEAYFPLFLNKVERSVYGVALQDDRIVHDVPQTTVSFTGHKVTAPAASEEEARGALKRILFASVVQFVRSEVNCNKEEFVPASSDPRTCLDRLHAALATPRRLIWMHSSMLRITKLGILLSETESGGNLENTGRAEDMVALNEVAIGTCPTRVVLLASYPRDEMLAPAELAAEYPLYSL